MQQQKRTFSGNPAKAKSAFQHKIIINLLQLFIIFFYFLTLGNNCLASSPAGAEIKTSVLIAEADGFRRPEARTKDKYDIEFGFQNTGGTVKVGCPDKSRWHSYGYFRFDLSNIPPESIQKATLRLYNRYWHWKKSIQDQCHNASIQVEEITDDSWDERAMLWDGNPASGKLISTKQDIRRGWNEIDVTDFVRSQRDNKASFRVGLSDKLTAVFISREGRTDWRPQLVIEHASDTVIPKEPELVSTSKLPKGSLWLVHKGKWTQYSGFRDPKTNKLHYALQEAMYDAKPGDEIVLGPGRHYERVRTWDKNKTPVNNIVIRGDGFPRPVIDGSGVESFMEDTWNCNGIIQIFRSSNITIENLELANVSTNTGHSPHWSAIWIEAKENQPANNTKIINVYAHHTGNGIHTNQLTGNLSIENCEFAYNGYYGGSGQQHGVYLEGKGTNKVRASEFHHNGGQGYKDRGKFTILSGNYIHDNGNYEFDFMQNNMVDSPQDAMIIGNLIVKTPYAMNYSKIGAFGGGSDSICKPGNPVWPQCKDRHGGVASFINNTFVIPCSAPSRSFLQLIDPKKTRRDTIELYNNIFYSTDPKGKNESLLLHTNNTPENITGSNNWISPHVKINANISESIRGENDNESHNDPGFENPSIGNFYLSAKSQNRNAGTSQIKQFPDTMYIHPSSMILREIKEGAIDVGAYEYKGIPHHQLQVKVMGSSRGKVVSNTIDLAKNIVNTTSEALHSFYQGSEIQLTAVETPGSKLLHWTDESGNIISQKNPLGILMDSSKKVTAHFTPSKTCSLYVIVEGTGSGFIRTDRADQKILDTVSTFPLQVNQGKKITLTPKAEADSFFAGWSGNGYRGTGSLTIPMDTDITLHALFEERPEYQVIVTLAGSGSGDVTGTIVTNSGEKRIIPGQLARNPSSLIFSLPQGHTIRLRAAPHDNSSFAGWVDKNESRPKLGVWETTIEEPTQVRAKFISLSSGSHWGQTKVMPKSTNYWDPSYISQGGIMPKNALITSMNIYLKASTGGNNNTAIALYAGGVSNTNPKDAQLIWNAGIIYPGGQKGWFTIEHPDKGIFVPANTRLWIRIKNKGRSHVYFGTSKKDVGDFFPTGAYNDKFDWKSTFQDKCPANGSGTVNKWYSLFLTYTPQP